MWHRLTQHHHRHRRLNIVPVWGICPEQSLEFVEVRILEDLLVADLQGLVVVELAKLRLIVAERDLDFLLAERIHPHWLDLLVGIGLRNLVVVDPVGILVGRNFPVEILAGEIGILPGFRNWD